MRERPGSGVETSAGEEVKGRPKRIDLSVPQVAGSAVAAVMAAKLASSFGVYGTILGAGVVSAIATCGGTLFQHFFQRTGQQFRDATGAARPRGPEPAAPGAFTEGTVYRARVRTWRRPLVAAALVFAVAMAGITTYELVSGGSFSGGSGTTVSGAVAGGTRPSGASGSSRTPPSSVPKSGQGGTASPGPSPSSPARDGSSGSPARTPADAGTTTPAPVTSGTPGTAGESGADGQPNATPTPTGSSAIAPESSAGSRSGTAGPDQAGPAAP
ncbi:hypothetical protein ACFWIJ_34415 [Streptomyces sp. NPDC127079]|uniref:hypothetical protein n=1 Tax=Streptomyces sp. NPDC127079 TaxID=3347132 RepID=UPI00365C5853